MSEVSTRRVMKIVLSEIQEIVSLLSRISSYGLDKKIIVGDSNFDRIYVLGESSKDGSSALYRVRRQGTIYESSMVDNFVRMLGEEKYLSLIKKIEKVFNTKMDEAVAEEVLMQVEKPVSFLQIPPSDDLVEQFDSFLKEEGLKPPFDELYEVSM